MFYVISRHGAVTRRQGCAAPVRQLIGVQLDRQAQGAGLVEQARHLLDREGDRLAIGVHGVHQPLGLCGRQDVIDGQIDIGGAVRPMLGRNGVQTQIGGAHANPAFPADAAGDPQHLQFAVLIQSIARLDLDRGDARGLEPLQPVHGGGVQFVLRRRARGLDRSDDPAAGAGDILIGGPAQPLFEFARAVAAEDQMRVTVDQSRREPASAQPLRLDRLYGRQIRARSDPGDTAVGDDHGGVADGPIGGPARNHGGGVTVDQQAVGLHRLRSLAWAEEKSATRS